MKTPLITASGLQTLKEELDRLWRTERPNITQKVTWAAGLGDRSENADYQYNKRRLREIDRRVRYLRRCIADLRVVEYSPQQEGKVYFGAWVTVASEAQVRLHFRILGYEEIFGRDDAISIDSPMARALLGKSEGDWVEVTTGAGVQAWEIIDIRYEPLQD